MAGLWIVTGAEGFLGNVLVRELVRRGQKVRACVLDDVDAPSLQGVECERRRVDVRDLDALRRAFEGTNRRTTVVHCAGVVSIAGSVSDAVREVNVGGTSNVLTVCREFGVRRLVHVSSVHALPEYEGTITEELVIDPDMVVGEYAKTKAEATVEVLGASDVDCVVVHPSGIMGPGDYGDSHLTRLVRDLVSGKLSSIVAGRYDFVDVRDVADGIIAAARRGKRGQNYILNGHLVSMREIAVLVGRATGRRRLPHVLPMWFARASAPLAELYYRIRRTPPLYTSYSLHTLTAPAVFSHALAARHLRYAPRPIRATIRDTVLWLRNHDRPPARLPTTDCASPRRDEP